MKRLLVATTKYTSLEDKFYLLAALVIPLLTIVRYRSPPGHTSCLVDMMLFSIGILVAIAIVYAILRPALQKLDETSET